MSIVQDAIEVKKFGGELDGATIAAVVDGYTSGQIPDYQMAALLMAVRLRGMTYEETLAMTQVMADSGVRYAFPDCVDKHSTGGVGDKVTLTALPLVAAAAWMLSEGAIGQLASTPAVHVARFGLPRPMSAT